MTTSACPDGVRALGLCPEKDARVLTSKRSIHRVNTEEGVRKFSRWSLRGAIDVDDRGKTLLFRVKRARYQQGVQARRRPWGELTPPLLAAGKAPL